MTPSASTSSTIYALTYASVAGIPLLLTVMCCTPMKKTIGSLLPWAPVPALLIAVFSPLHIFVDVPWFFMGGRMGLDETGRIFLVLSGFIWLLAAFNANRRLLVDHKHARFNGFFLAAMAGNFGLILAQGMLGYYLFFALMSFATYGLVAHTQTDESQKAGRIYLVLVMIGEVALFIALVIMSSSVPNLAITTLGPPPQPLTILLLFIGFGVKIGALPCHSWMPLAYQATAIPAATALAGAMVNAGILGWLRFIPLGQVTCPRESILFIVAGAMASLYGVALGLTKKKPGAILACSSISQMGLMTVIFGLGLSAIDAGKQAATILVIYVAHHSLAKSCLFLGYDKLESRQHRPTPGQLAILLIPALALAGLPFTSGAIAKTAFKGLTSFIGPPWLGIGRWFLPLTAVGTTMLVLHFIDVLYRAKSKHHRSVSHSSLPFTASLIAVVATLWLWPVSRHHAGHSLVAIKIWYSFWPVMLGSLLFTAWTCLREKSTQDSHFFESNESTARQSKIPSYRPSPGIAARVCHSAYSHFLVMVLWLQKTEKIVGRWTVAGLSYLVLCLILFILLRS